MKLRLDTRVNMVMFYDGSNEVIASSDMNMTFGEFLDRCPKRVSDMKSVTYEKTGSYTTKDSLGQDIRLDSYSYTNKSGGSTKVYGFIEILYIEDIMREELLKGLKDIVDLVV